MDIWGKINLLILEIVEDGYFDYKCDIIGFIYFGDLPELQSNNCEWYIIFLKLISIKAVADKRISRNMICGCKD